jgi:hypothetical protein
MAEETGRWPITLRVNLPTIGVIAVQTAGIALGLSWYASAYNSRLSATEDAIQMMGARVSMVESAEISSRIKMAEIGTELKFTNQTLTEIKRLLEQMQQPRWRAGPDYDPR